MKIRIAYIEEPPFYWTGPREKPTGADIELAEVVLHAIGVSSIEYHLTSFAELLPGVREGCWDMNVPIFITPERAKQVTFSVPVWALGDGFLVIEGNPKALTSYEAVAERSDCRLGLVADQVQIESAKSAGVTENQMVVFKEQTAAVDALIEGKIDAFAATTVGNRVLAAKNKTLKAVALEAGKADKALMGGFSFNTNNECLMQAVNEQLRKYLGSPDHRARMKKYGITNREIDGVLAK